MLKSHYTAQGHKPWTYEIEGAGQSGQALQSVRDPQQCQCDAGQWREELNPPSTDEHHLACFRLQGPVQ